MQREGLMATFMAKWSNDYPGQSGHIHVSLGDPKTGRNRLPRRGRALRDERDDAAFRGGAGALPAGAALDGVRDGERLSPARAGTLGADGVELGCREPHDGDPRDSRRARRASAASTGSHRPTRIPISRSRPPLPPDSPASKSGSSCPSPSSAAPTTRRRRPSSPSRPASPRRAADCADRRWPAAPSATRSSSISPRPATGRIRAFRRSVSDWDLARYFEII